MINAKLDEFSDILLELVEETLLGDKYYVKENHDRIFDDEYKLADKSFEERKSIYEKIKKDKSKNIMLKYLVFSYMAKDLLQKNLYLIEKDKYMQMRSLTRMLAPYSSPFEILYYFSLVGIEEKKFLNEKEKGTISVFARHNLSKITWQDIESLTKEQIKLLSPNIIYDWKKITNSSVADSEIEMLYKNRR